MTRIVFGNLFGNLVRVGLASMILADGITHAEEPVAGRDFTVVEPAVSMGEQNKIVVTEFFSYQCPHCYAFSRPLEAWAAKLPADVVFRRESVTIGHDTWEPSARTFYVLESLGKLRELDAKLFDAIHQEGLPLLSQLGIGTWVSQHGVSWESFDAEYRSPKVDAKFKRGQQLAAAHLIPSVPTISVDGKYLVAIVGNVDYGVQLAKVEALIAKVRAERKKK